MTNQAAQTMPSVDAFMAKWEWLILSRCRDEFLADLAALSQTAGVAEGWMRDVADAAAALDKRGDRQMAARLMRLHRDMLAAAPAASGGEANPSTCIHRFGHDGRVCLRCGWNFRENGDPPQPPAVASVSERARVTQAMLDAGTSAMIEFRKSGGDWTDKPAHAAEVVIRAAIEQALTQQRGEAPAAGGVPFGHYWVWKDGTAQFLLGQSNWALESACKSVTPLYTTPQPSADAVRELVKRILNWQPLTSINKADRLYQILIAAGIPFESVTDELESLLSGDSNA